MSVFDIKKQLYEFEGVKVFDSDRDFLEIDGVIYVHGWLSTKFSHVNYFDKSVVRGHSHRARLIVRQEEKNDYRYMFEMECGHLVNHTALPLSYTPTKYSKWKPGIGIIENGIPRLVVL